MSRTLQFRRYNSLTLANTIGANGELIINTTNKTLTVHDGSTPGGFALLNSSTDFNEDTYARTTANTAIANTIILQNVNNTQNTRLNSIETVNGTQNTRIDSIETVNGTQNNNITFATSLAQSAYDYANTRYSSSGGQISGNVVISGTLDVTGNTVIARHLDANTVIVETTLYSGLASRSATPLPHLVAQFTSNSNTYTQVNTQNIDPQGSADFIVTADNGSDTNYYLDIGMLGSQYNNEYPINSLGTAGNPYDGYLYVQGSTIGQIGGNLVIGTTSTTVGQDIKFVVGGSNEEHIVVKITHDNMVLNGNLRFSDATTQTSASISIVALKALVANAATYTDFQTAIADL